MRSPWDRDVSWLFNPQESRGLEPKIRAAVSMAWIRCCEISRKYLRQQEPLQEPLEQAVVRLHHDLEQAPTLPDVTAAEMLVKHYGTCTRAAAARKRKEARRFVVLPEVRDSKDIESVVQVQVDLATVLKSMDQDQYDLIVLRYLCHKSWKEIGQQKGISDRAARGRCAKAIKKLQAEFGWREASR